MIKRKRSASGFCAWRVDMACVLRSVHGVSMEVCFASLPVFFCSPCFCSSKFYEWVSDRASGAAALGRVISAFKLKIACLHRPPPHAPPLPLPLPPTPLLLPLPFFSCFSSCHRRPHPTTTLSSALLGIGIAALLGRAEAVLAVLAVLGRTPGRTPRRPRRRSPGRGTRACGCRCGRGTSGRGR